MPTQCRGHRWFVDETYAKVAGIWQYVSPAVDQHGQVIDVYVSKRRDIASATTFLTTMLQAHNRPQDVTTDLAAPRPQIHQHNSATVGSVTERCHQAAQSGRIAARKMCRCVGNPRRFGWLSGTLRVCGRRTTPSGSGTIDTASSPPTGSLPMCEACATTTRWIHDQANKQGRQQDASVEKAANAND
jgi:hypothetical protein